MKKLKLVLWWLLAAVAFLFMPVPYLVLNIQGHRTTWRELFRIWKDNFDAREPWGPWDE